MSVSEESVSAAFITVYKRDGRIGVHYGNQRYFTRGQRICLGDGK